MSDEHQEIVADTKRLREILLGYLQAADLPTMAGSR